MLRNTTLTVLLCCSFSASFSQDANYWFSGYSAGGFFTPGAVIAANRDSGVTYYNPALLAWSHTNTATISGTVYEYENIRIKNGTGTGLDLRSPGTHVIPQMMAGNVSLKGKRNMSLAYALVREPVMSFNASQRVDKHANVLNDTYSNGDENFIGQFSEQNTVSNTSLQLSAGWQLSHEWSAGITIDGLLRKQSYLLNTNNRAIYAGASDSLFPPSAGTSEFYTVDYTQLGLRARLGVSYNHNAHHLGLLLTSPLWRLGGTATMVANQEIENLHLAGTTFNLFASTRQTGLKAVSKTPFSAALGYAYDYSRYGQVYLAAEYFSSIGMYNVITPRDEYFIRPDTGDNNLYTSELLQMRDAHKAVLNVAMGVSFKIAPLITGFTAFRTDFSYASDSLLSAVGYRSFTSQWNNWHLQLGGNFRQRKFNLRAGLLFSYGHTNNYRQKMSFDNPSESNLLQGDVTYTSAGRFAVGVLLTYVYNF